MKLKTKFLLFTSALTALFAVFIIYYLVNTARNGMVDRAKDRANNLISFITEISAKQLESGRINGLDRTLAAFENFDQVAYLRVTDTKGNVIYRMGHPGILIDERVPDQDFFSSGDIYDTARDIIRDGRKLGAIKIGISMAGIRESMQVLMWRGIIIALGFLALISGTVWLLTLKLGRQLDTLLELAGRMDSETLPPAAGTDFASDTAKIGTALRGMHARLKAERQRRLEAETQKDDFFAMTVHDLKQPLTSLKAALDLLLSEEERREYSKEQLTSLSEIARTSLRMLNTMVVDILNTAKLKSRDYAPEKERIPLAALLRECAEENSASVTAAGKRWLFSMPEDIGAAWVFGDRDLIKRVVGNLVLNAIQYTPEGGAIKLGARFVSGDKAALYVSDEGKGIPDNFREQIFEKYRSLGKSSKNIGLGLAFCKMVADMHSADMNVSSEKGKGTEVSFVIPVSHGAEAKRA